ncbi:hypothetical protein V5799_024932 [Amblyomma americanum]|uniref:Uncharacterized protein n=1 Tax=Amblyomma americanum TaxID=6943 RepID=A0AAQ4EB60_AMBAM
MLPKIPERKETRSTAGFSGRTRTVREDCHGYHTAFAEHDFRLTGGLTSSRHDRLRKGWKWRGRPAAGTRRADIRKALPSEGHLIPFNTSPMRSSAFPS